MTFSLAVARQVLEHLVEQTVVYVHLDNDDHEEEEEDNDDQDAGKTWF